jgi:hypothetical protein
LYFIVAKETIITMKCTVCVYGLALLCSPVVALQQARRVGVAVRSAAQDHLEDPVRKIHVALFLGL